MAFQGRLIKGGNVAIAIGLADGTSGCIVTGGIEFAQGIGALGDEAALVVLEARVGPGLIGEAGKSADGVVLTGDGGMVAGFGCGRVAVGINLL